MSDLNALDLQPGQMVGGYTLIGRLGGGAMGSVWRVRDDGGQIYAMKILRDSLNEESPDDGAPGTSANPNIADHNAYRTDTPNGRLGNTSVFPHSASAGNGSYTTTMPDATRRLEPDGANTVQSAPGATPTHMTPSMRRNPHVTARERLRREAMALQKVRHPGVCSIVDMELDDALAFIVTELIEGRNLRDDVATNGRYAGEDLERLAHKLINAVRAVHAQGIIHRDIKPTNVMVSAAGPVLVDFGIAMTQGESHVTRTGLVMGTPGFIAPEIIDGAESDELTDWWSLASVLAFAATGHTVFGDKPMMAVLEREVAGSANLAGLPQRTLNAFRQALNPDRSKRCGPEQLLEAISADAIDSGDFANNNEGNEAGTVFPFDSSTSATAADVAHSSGSLTGTATHPSSSDNPRTLWNDDAASYDAAPTTAMTTSYAEYADAYGSPHSSTYTTPNADPPTEVLSTALLPESSDIIAPQTALQAPLSQTAAQTEVQTAGRPSGLPQPTLQPAAASDLVSFHQANLLSQAKLPIWLMAIPLALLSSAYPIAGVTALAVLIWLFTTLGFSEQAQLEREAKHGGVRRSSDSTHRCLTMPWHAIKGFAAGIPHMAWAAIIAILPPIIIGLMADFPHSIYNIPLGSQNLPIPVFQDQPVSPTGATLAVCAAAAWLLIAFRPKSSTIRLGVGYLQDGATQTVVTLSPSPQVGSVPVSSNLMHTGEFQSPNTAPPSGRPHGLHNHKNVVLFAIWCLITLWATAVSLPADQISWFPL